MPGRRVRVQGPGPFLIIATGALHRTGGGANNKCCIESHPGRDCWTPTEHPQFEITCPWCRGEARECAECGSTGKIEFFRCQATYFGQAELDVVRSVRWLEMGVLPVAGGMVDQAAQWVDAVGVVMAEFEEYRQAAMEKASSDH